MTNEIHISGEYTDAVVKIGELEEETVDQIQEMVNKPGIRNPVRIMPDAHPGKGSVIGFTMPLGTRVIPNIVGVDIGCGMFAACLPGYPDIRDWEERKVLEDAIRERVPVGNSIHKEGPRHMHEEFPWDECQRKVEEFNKNSDMEDIKVEYGPDYYDDLVSRINVSSHKVINSLGTLGGGNHFIEIGEGQEEDAYWVIIHSGSRNPGYEVARYWQRKAAIYQGADKAREHLTQYPDEYIRFNLDEVSDSKLLDWLLGGVDGDFINYDAIPKTEREKYRNELKKAVPDNGKEGTPYDYLEGEYARGYIRDMIFAQTYASISRKEMADLVLEAWMDEIYPTADLSDDDSMLIDSVETIESTHNYIDPEDQVIRKGATRAHEGERAIVPYNMRDGTLIVRGKGNEDWHRTINHGAGRVDSRGWAGNEVTQEEVNEIMEDADIQASIVPRDEAPHAYKDFRKVEDAMKPSAEIVERIEPLINIKAETRYYDAV